MIQPSDTLLVEFSDMALHRSVSSHRVADSGEVLAAAVPSSYRPLGFGQEAEAAEASVVYSTS